QVICCAKPLTRLGQNAGRADETIGHPEDLDEEIVLLYDETGEGEEVVEGENPVQWIALERSEGIPFYNHSGQTAPAYAAMVQLHHEDDEFLPELLHIKQVEVWSDPFCELHSGPYFVNFGSDVSDGEVGMCWPLG
ncbi:unnamed protein product, partial [marine sediment metagenome]